MLWGCMNLNAGLIITYRLQMKKLKACMGCLTRVLVMKLTESH